MEKRGKFNICTGRQIIIVIIAERGINMNDQNENVVTRVMGKRREGGGTEKCRERRRENKK